jgi:excisionase family DNA binding protein
VAESASAAGCGTDAPVERLTWSVREMAASLGVHVNTVYAWVEEGRIPYARIGGRILFPVDAVRGWLARLALDGDEEKAPFPVWTAPERSPTSSRASH